MTVLDGETIRFRPIVGVMGSGTRPYTQLARPLGTWLAVSGFNLLTGGGAGVMTAVSRAFYETPGRQGVVVGVLPGRVNQETHTPSAGYPNLWVEIPIYTHLPVSGDQGADLLSRNHINILSSDVVVALPGNDGTANEMELALRYGRPIIAFLSPGDQLPDGLARVPVTHSLETVKSYVRTALGADADGTTLQAGRRP